MPRYFFNLLHPGRPTVLDGEGLVFADDGAARIEGMASLKDFINDSLTKDPRPLCVSVEIRAEGGDVVDRLTGHVMADRF